MRDWRSSRHLLGVSLVLSLATHLSLAAAFVRISVGYADSNPASGTHAANLAFEPPEPPDIRLGIDRSDAVTLNWLGFESPSEHEALEAETEQSAMTLAEGHQPDPAPAPMPEPAAVPAPEELAGGEAREVTPVASQPIEAMRDLAREAMAAADDVTELLDAATRSAAALAQRWTEAASRVSTPQPAPIADSVSTAAPPPPSRPRPTPGGQPGFLTDKEASASAIANAPSVRLGRVVAAEGLNIKTRRPTWSYSTQLLRRPANPVVQITFGRDGKVRSAGFARDGAVVRNTGFPDVDEPLLNAVYAWTATGQALHDLPEDDPDAGITVTLRVILIG